MLGTRCQNVGVPLQDSPGGQLRSIWTTLRVAQTVVVALIAGTVSLTRILVVNPQALAGLLWAEDGLFPLCVRKAGLLTCLVDPFAGYFLFLPRMVAGFTALFPISWWPLIANATAALLAAVIAAWVMLVLRRAGCSFWFGALVAILPVLTPMVGYETIGAIGSIYLPLLFAATITVAFPQKGRAFTVLAAVLLLLTVLTLPTAVILVLPILGQAHAGRIRKQAAGLLAGVLIVGAAIQLGFGLFSEHRRQLSATTSTFFFWVENLPTYLAQFAPGLVIPEATLFVPFPITVARLLGAITVAVVVAVSLWLLISRRGSKAFGVATLLVMGLALSAIPVILGNPNNRYYAVTMVLWAAAGLLVVDMLVVRLRGNWQRGWATAAIVVALVVLWIPGYPAASWRAMAGPNWQDEIARAAQVCAVDQNAVVNFMMTPNWPAPGIPVYEPTTGLIRCDAVTDVGIPQLAR